MKNNKKGFTLIELMIAVGIVGILSAVAIPAYQNYVARSQMSEGISLASGAKALISEYYSNYNAWPTQFQVGYNGANGKYISKTEIADNGTIVATLSTQASSKIAGQTITLTPTVQSEGNLSWDCVSSADSIYLPSSCTHSAPVQQPPFSGTIAYNGSLKVTNGVLTFGRTNTPATLVSTDLNGTEHYTGLNGATFTLYPNGTLDTFSADGSHNRYYYDTSAIAVSSVMSPDGKTPALYFNIPASSPYYSTSYSTLASASSTAYGNYYNNPTQQNYDALVSANQTQLNYFNQFKNANGSWPTNMPQSVINMASNNIPPGK